MFKRCKINILPANQISPLSFVGVEKKTLCYDKKLLKKLSKLSWFMSGYSLYELTKTIRFQHLYITNNDDIREGDWVFDFTNHGLIYQVNKVTTTHLSFKDALHYRGLNNNNLHLKNHYKKIIVTTDKLPLESYQGHFNDIDCTKYVPQPSQPFIEKYVEEYNKGNVITDVMVEYNTHCCNINVQGGMNSPDCCHNHITTPKISKDNTVNIILKELWTTKEVKQLCWQAFINFKCLEGKIRPSDAELLLTPFNEWVKENL